MRDERGNAFSGRVYRFEIARAEEYGLKQLNQTYTMDCGIGGPRSPSIEAVRAPGSSSPAAPGQRFPATRARRPPRDVARRRRLTYVWMKALDGRDDRGDLTVFLPELSDFSYRPPKRR